MVPCPKGTPRYLEGKDPLMKPKILTIFHWVMGDVFKKNTCDFSALTANPDAFAKSVKFFLKV